MPSGLGPAELRWRWGGGGTSGGPSFPGPVQGHRSSLHWGDRLQVVTGLWAAEPLQWAGDWELRGGELEEIGVQSWADPEFIDTSSLSFLNPQSQWGGTKEWPARPQA